MPNYDVRVQDLIETLNMLKLGALTTPRFYYAVITDQYARNRVKFHS